MTPLQALQERHDAIHRVRTDLFGPLHLADEQIVHFDDGVPGFAQCKRWVLIDGAKGGTAWLQSADNPALAFLLVDPFVVFEGFTADVGPHEVRRLGAIDPSQLAVFSIVTLPQKGQDDATANLQAPVVINVRSRKGAQVLLGDGPWQVRQPLSLSSLR